MFTRKKSPTPEPPGAPPVPDAPPDVLDTRTGVTHIIASNAPGGFTATPEHDANK